MKRIFTAPAAFVLLALPFTLPLVLQGCDSESTASPLADASTDTISPDVATSTDAGTPDVAKDAAAQPALSTVADFDAAGFELAEGLAIHGGNAYVSLAPLGKIVKVTPGGAVSTYASVPPGYDDGYTLGMAFDGQDNLYVTETKNTLDAGVTPGVYKIPPTNDGGLVSTPFATDAIFAFPNAIAFDARGNLLVTDSGAGLIAKVTPAGAVSTWSQDPELSGSPACPAPLPFPIGANGIVFTPGAVYATNTAKGSIVKIAVDANGDAGAVSTIVKDCQYVGLDGLALDGDGTLLATQNGSPGRLLRVTTAGDVTVLHATAPLDGPASVAVAPSWNGKHVALVTNSAFFSIGVDGGAPKPGLLQYGPLP
jgi:sugar lactone lactonase YvrE